MRTADITRNTKTQIRVTVNLDGTGLATLDSGIRFSTTCSIKSRVMG